MNDNLVYSLNVLAGEDIFNPSEIPDYITNNVAHKLRDYQTEALARFRFYIDDDGYKNKKKPIHLLFHMATGSGKTIVMAGCILELYKKGHRNFLFFVNSDNIIDKTKHNLLYQNSNKYLFNKDKIIIDNKAVAVKVVENFNEADDDSINICFNTIQKLHGNLINTGENGISTETFKDTKVAIISDEAHHINSMTKKESKDEQNWENSVLGILNANNDNVMLEFTATMGMKNEAIAKKYNDKVIYDYTFLKFNIDKYSKNVFTLASTFDNNYKILQAIVLSQYRLKLAVHHKVNPLVKPVILVKSKFIKDSTNDYKEFYEFLERLKETDLDKIENGSESKEIKSAFEFFKKNKITNENLVLELKQAFKVENSVITDSTKSTLNAKVLLNTLEDEKNKIRIIFVVNQLNEGWDAINLYDIVRLYNTKDKGNDATVSEAQLIGRGARYCPFTTKDSDEDKYKRKFDADANNELSILEEFYFHCDDNSKYISELKAELKTQGIIEEEVPNLVSIELKESFKESDFYEKGCIFLNKQEPTDKAKNFKEVKKLIKSQAFKYNSTIEDGRSNSKNNLLKGDILNENSSTKRTETLDKDDFSKQIIQTAFDRNPYFNFDKMKKYCGGKVESMKDFIDQVMENVKVEVRYQGNKDTLLTPRVKLDIFSNVLGEISKIMEKNNIEKRGTREFSHKKILEIFIDKKFKSSGTEKDMRGHKWFAYDKNYGTSLENDFIKYIIEKKEEIEDKYAEFYLLRSERFFRLYDFEQGRGFEPDFVMFFKKNGSEEFSNLQVFIEPKGGHLLEHDKWKSKFLESINKNVEFGDDLFNDSKDFKIIGLPFYVDNKELLIDEKKFTERKFKEAFKEQIFNND
ncbi:MAG: DEAD/DEAH box helicase family protein [Alphaproteobacteria bacterium]|nr:DEAD/DEAH box helicase family protein [Alphaproteobacteria bacterium]